MVAKTKAKTATGNQVMDWEAEMKAQAKIAAEAQRSGGAGGSFISTRAGVLTYQDNPLPGNQMAVVILADIMENSWYEGEYDPSTPASPKCFAFGHDEDDMEPHEAVDGDPYFERQSATCSECPHAEWGSSPRGRGKACKNVMRLALIPAGVYKGKGTGRNQTFDLELYEDEEHFRKAEVAFIKIPVTSVALYAKYVKQLNADLSLPPHGVITNIYIEPHPKYQYQVKFELQDTLDTALFPIIIPRHKAEAASIDFPYQPPQEPEEGAAPAKAGNKLRGKTAGKRR